MLMLVRMDTLKHPRAAEVFGTPSAELTNATTLLGEDEQEPPAVQHRDMLIPAAMREQWGDFECVAPLYFGCAHHGNRLMLMLRNITGSR